MECCLSDVKYPLCFLATLVTRPISVLFTVYCLMWIVSFVDQGKIADDIAAQSVYQKITLISLPVSYTHLTLPTICSV